MEAWPLETYPYFNKTTEVPLNKRNLNAAVDPAKREPQKPIVQTGDCEKRADDYNLWALT